MSRISSIIFLNVFRASDEVTTYHESDDSKKPYTKLDPLYSTLNLPRILLRIHSLMIRWIHLTLNFEIIIIILSLNYYYKHINELLIKCKTRPRYSVLFLQFEKIINYNKCRILFLRPFLHFYNWTLYC